MTTDFRALCAELLRGLDEIRHPEGRYQGHLRLAMASARAALADEPAAPGGREPAAVTGQPSVEELALVYHDCCGGCEFMDQGGFEDAVGVVLARWGNRQGSLDSSPPADGEVAELVAEIRHFLAGYQKIRGLDPEHIYSIHRGDKMEAHIIVSRLTRAAELLQRQALVPVPVSDALIKAECALSDIAEGEPMTDEGDPLQWAERRCADTLAVIRPTMRQHKIRTSEWPPVPAHALPLPEASE